MSTAQEMLLARVEMVEAHLASAGCSDAEKEALMPKLAQMRAVLDDLNTLYESRLAEVQERNKQALTNLEKLSARVERRASAAVAEKEAAEVKAQAQAEAKAEAEAKVAAKKAKKAKKQSMKKASQLRATQEDTLLLMGAVMSSLTQFEVVQTPFAQTPVAPTPILETPCIFTTLLAYKPVIAKSVTESPYVPFQTPECWESHDRVGSLFLGAELCSAC